MHALHTLCPHKRYTYTVLQRSVAVRQQINKVESLFSAYLNHRTIAASSNTYTTDNIHERYCAAQRRQDEVSEARALLHA